MIIIFPSGVSLILSKSEDLFSGSVKNFYKEKVGYFLSKNVSKNVSSEISKLLAMHALMDIVEVSGETSIDVLDVSKIYFHVGDRLNYNWLRSEVAKLSQRSYWDRMLVKALEGDIDDQQRRIAEKIAISPGNNIKDKCNVWESKHQKELDVFSEFITTLQSSNELNSAKLVVAIKQSAILVK